MTKIEHLEQAGEGHWPANDAVQVGLKWIYNELGYVTTGNWNAEDVDY